MVGGGGKEPGGGGSGSARGGGGNSEPGAGGMGRLVLPLEDDEDVDDESMLDDAVDEDDAADAADAAEDETEASVSASITPPAPLPPPTADRSLVSSAMKAEYSLSSRFFSFSRVVPASLRQSRVKCVDSPQISHTTLAGAHDAPVRFGHW